MRHLFWSLILILVCFELFSLLPPRIERTPQDDPPFLTGAVHIPFPIRGDSNRVQKLTRFARKAQLDFLVLANLDETLPTELAGTHHGIDIFTEFEAATPAGHTLLFYSHTTAAALPKNKLKELAWRHFLGTDSRPGIFSVVAHPSSVFTPWERFDRIPDGIELINLRSLLERQAFDSPLSFGFTLLTWPFNPYLTALRLWEPNIRDFKGWDAINTVSPGHFGMIATDDLSDWPILGKLGTWLPQWDQTLGVAANVVFPEEKVSEDFAERRSQIYRALRHGRSALLFQAIHPFSGNDWSLQCGEKTYRSGDKEAQLRAGCEFVVKTPATLSVPKRLVLWKDGSVAQEISVSQPIERIKVEEPGIYRLEVWVKQKTLFRVLLDKEVPYLFYNPLYIGSGG